MEGNRASWQPMQRFPQQTGCSRERPQIHIFSAVPDIPCKALSCIHSQTAVPPASTRHRCPAHETYRWQPHRFQGKWTTASYRAGGFQWMLAHSSKLFARVQIHVTGTFTVPLLHRSRSGIHGYTFRMILLAPLISAFIRMPFLLLYNPRLILLPEKACVTSFP